MRRFRDGHTERWWAAELTLLGYGPANRAKAICATTDRRALPALPTCYLSTNLSPEQAPLGEIVRLYGLRNWIEQGYKQMKDELGWADFMVRSDRAIRRHWALACCAFSFCWWHAAIQARARDPCIPSNGVPATPPRARKKNQQQQTTAVLAPLVACGTRLADTSALACALLERLRRYACQHRPRHSA